MSVQALSCAFAVRGIGSSEKLVLLALANFANDKMQCWPSQERLALDTELSPRTVWSALRGLEDKGMVSRTSRKRADGSRTTDVFTLHFVLTVHAEPLADFANTPRKLCNDHSQLLQEPVAAVATLTAFEPSVNHQVEPLEAQAPPPKADPRGSRLPDDWSPSSSDELLAGISPQTVAVEADKFRDYWRAIPGAKGRKLDWDATWRNWIRRNTTPGHLGNPYDKRNALPPITAREDSLRAHHAGAMAALNRRIG